MGKSSLSGYGALVGRICCGPLRSLCYLVVDLREGEAALVNAGCPAEEVLGALGGLGVELRLVLLTHTHFDHVASLEEICESTGARLGLSPTPQMWRCSRGTGAGAERETSPTWSRPSRMDPSFPWGAEG
ncbi:MAG: MBL fold metallo-hydrolase [Candidatus Korarchaeota archaeon]|nr:MBL fold metallo-hydrolase [Candidatus Korarchaeota archaeon]